MRARQFFLVVLLTGRLGPVWGQPADTRPPEPPLRAPAARPAASDTTPKQEAIWLYEEAVRLHREGYLTRAIDGYRRALAKDPQRLEYRPYLGLALDQSGQSQEAMEQYDLYLHMEPRDWRVHLDRAGALLHLGRLDESAAELESARPYLADRADFQEWAGLLQLKQNNSAGAVISFREALRLDPQRLDARVNLGLALLQAGDSAGAEQELEVALKQKSGPVILNNLGIIQVQQNHLPEAAKLFQEAWQPPSSDSPSDARAVPEALLNGATLLARQGKDREALLLVSKLLDYKSDFVDAQILDARLLTRLGRAPEARKELDKVMATGEAGLAGRWPYVLEVSGLVNLGLEEDEAAKKDLQRALTLNPASLSAKHNLALALGRLGEFPQAIKLELEASQVSPDNKAVWYHLGVLYDLDARPAQAIAAYERFLQIAPQDPEADGLKEHIEELQGAVRKRIGEPIPPVPGHKK